MADSGTGALVDQLLAELMKTGADTDEMAFNNAEIQASVDGLLDVVDEMRRMNAELRLENERLLRVNEAAISSSEESVPAEEAVQLLVGGPASHSRACVGHPCCDIPHYPMNAGIACCIASHIQVVYI